MIITTSDKQHLFCLPFMYIGACFICCNCSKQLLLTQKVPLSKAVLDLACTRVHIFYAVFQHNKENEINSVRESTYKSSHIKAYDFSDEYPMENEKGWLLTDFATVFGISTYQAKQGHCECECVLYMHACVNTRKRKWITTWLI